VRSEGRGVQGAGCASGLIELASGCVELGRKAPISSCPTDLILPNLDYGLDGKPQAKLAQFGLKDAMDLRLRLWTDNIPQDDTQRGSDLRLGGEG
jgi:hypothetical protein